MSALTSISHWRPHLVPNLCFPFAKTRVRNLLRYRFACNSARTLCAPSLARIKEVDRAFFFRLLDYLGPFVTTFFANFALKLGSSHHRLNLDSVIAIRSRTKKADRDLGCSLHNLCSRCGNPCARTQGSRTSSSFPYAKPCTHAPSTISFMHRFSGPHSSPTAVHFFPHCTKHMELTLVFRASTFAAPSQSFSIGKAVQPAVCIVNVPVEMVRKQRPRV